MTNNEKFLALVSEDDHATLDQLKWRIHHRKLLKASQRIALQILTRLDELEWEHTDLAREMGISSQQVRSILSGKETLSPEIQVKLQALLGIAIVGSQ